MDLPKRLVSFPDPSDATEEGVLAISRKIGVEYLIPAYLSGVFPWPVENESVLWFAPPVRAVLDFDELHVPSRMRRELKTKGFSLEVNRRFEEVMESCASKSRRGQDGTWITPKLKKAYCEFHHAGFAMSFETLDREGRLAGGMYGVLMGNYFSGESMFHIESGASKFALTSAVEWLKEKGLAWMDVQVMNPHLSSFGAKDIPREEFMRRIKRDCFIPA